MATITPFGPIATGTLTASPGWNLDESRVDRHEIAHEEKSTDNSDPTRIGVFDLGNKCAPNA
jgi:hypothetical protein